MKTSANVMCGEKPAPNTAGLLGICLIGAEQFPGHTFTSLTSHMSVNMRHEVRSPLMLNDQLTS